MSQLAGIVAVPVLLFTWLIKPKEFVSFYKVSWKFVLAIVFAVALFTVWIRGWFDWLAHPVTMRFWVLILLLGLLFVFGVLLIAASLKKLTVQIETQTAGKSASSAKPDWHNYVSDEIFGVIWRWRYIGNTIDHDSLAAFCPRSGCMNRLKIGLDPQNPNRPRDYYIFPESIVCHRCNFKHHFDCDGPTIERRVIDEIERLINTGQYVQRMKGNI